MVQVHTTIDEYTDAWCTPTIGACTHTSAVHEHHGHVDHGNIDHGHVDHGNVDHGNVDHGNVVRMNILLLNRVPSKERRNLHRMARQRQELPYSTAQVDSFDLQGRLHSPSRCAVR